jgi:hypothetical protein
MNNYIYKNPLENGYKQFKLTRKQHNKLFKHIKFKWTDKYSYFYNDNNILIYEFTNIPTKILMIIIFPIILLLDGIANIKEIIEEYKSMCNQKKYGSFCSNSIPSNTDTYKEIINIINKENK